MYLGKIVEMGSRDAIFGNPQHPYTQTLLSSIPLPDPRKRLRPRFPVIGELPSAANPPRGCRFHTRCWKAQSRCTLEEPALAAPDAGAGQSVACHFPEPVAGALAAAQRSARGRASGKPEAARTERGAANGVD
jgi:oligopeptide/dipeptide ABC transporter ATP-binding protein